MSLLESRERDTWLMSLYTLQSLHMFLPEHVLALCKVTYISVSNTV